MDYQLVVIRGRSSANAVKLQDGVTTAGRQDKCQLRIKSSQVSRKHCQLFEKHGMLLVKDLGSSNGTFVNGKKIEGQRVMEPGDELGIGPIVFRIEKIGQAVPAGSPAQASGPQPHDTAVTGTGTADAAVPVATAIPDDDEFEIDFDSVPEAALDDDMGFEIELDDPLSTPVPVVEAKPAMAPGLASSTKPSLKKSEPEPPPKQEDAGVADEAIADFLTGIKLDDED
jgi:pSer/pThr/pTyr-binding forkhead associated (FHA) protein